MNRTGDADGRPPGPIAPGKIILLDGPSSAGKSTLARALQAAMPEPFWHFSIDHLNSAGVLPQARIARGEFPWAGLRPAFFDGFHRCLPALAEAGNNLLVEHIVETSDWLRRLQRLMGHLDVFVVTLRCPLDELERRERTRGDRRLGDARADVEARRDFCAWDLEIDATQALGANVRTVVAAWKVRRHPGAFDRPPARR